MTDPVEDSDFVTDPVEDSDFVDPVELEDMLVESRDSVRDGELWVVVNVGESFEAVPEGVVDREALLFVSLPKVMESVLENRDFDFVSIRCFCSFSAVGEMMGPALPLISEENDWDADGVGGGVIVRDTETDGVTDFEGLMGILRVAVAVYFSHRQPSAVLSSAQLPLLYKTTRSST